MKIVFNPLTEQFDMVGDNDSSILIFDNYITDPLPCDLLTLSELKGRLTDESTIVFLEKAQINNSVIVKSTFAIKDYNGLYATVAQPGDTILKDFIPIPNKIFLCKADGQQYIYDGNTLRLLSTHSGDNIISFTAFEYVTSTINDDNPNNDSGTVVYDTNLNIFLYKIDDDAYYQNWYNKDMYIRDDKLLDDKIYFCKNLGVLCAVKLSNTGSVLTPIYQNSVGQNKSVIYPNSRIIINSVNDTKLNFGFIDDFYNQNYTSEIDIYFDKDYSELPTIGFPLTIQWNKAPTFNVGKHYSIIIECIIINDVKHYSGIWAEFDF